MATTIIDVISFEKNVSSLSCKKNVGKRHFFVNYNRKGNELLVYALGRAERKKISTNVCTLYMVKYWLDRMTPLNRSFIFLPSPQARPFFCPVIFLICIFFVIYPMPFFGGHFDTFFSSKLIVCVQRKDSRYFRFYYIFSRKKALVGKRKENRICAALLCKFIKYSEN